MYRFSLAPLTLILAFALFLSACAPAAEVVAPKAPLPDDVARNIARLDTLAQIKDELNPTAGRDTDIARLDKLAQIKDPVDPAVERDTLIARLDKLAQIKDQVDPAVQRGMLIARLDRLAQIKDLVMP